MTEKREAVATFRRTATKRSSNEQMKGKTLGEELVAGDKKDGS